jgi:hypothetical protein
MRVRRDRTVRSSGLSFFLRGTSRSDAVRALVNTARSDDRGSDKETSDERRKDDGVTGTPMGSIVPV